MNKDDIIRMAREAGFHAWYTQPKEHPDHVAIVEHFAALVAAAQKEACAKLLEDQWFRTQAECVEAIRARGQI